MLFILPVKVRLVFRRIKPVYILRQECQLSILHLPSPDIASSRHPDTPTDNVSPVVYVAGTHS